jgi:four helix bundle protein
MGGEKVYRGFMELEVWRQARELKLFVYDLIVQFPGEERYSLTDQLKRSVRSIGANIAEGYGRYSYKDQVHYCVQARGSLAETYNHIVDAVDCKYIDNDQLEKIQPCLDTTEKLLNGYISWLKKMQAAK